MTDIDSALQRLRVSTASFLAGLEQEKWTDSEIRLMSLLPGWTRGHVLTHIARNADSISRTISGALRGKNLKRYPAGPEGRAAAIEAGADRSTRELLTDVRDSAHRLDRLLTATGDVDGWDLHADDRAIGQHVIARWREVEVHRIDLAGRYTPANWPPAFVSYLVPKLVERIADRTESTLRISVKPDGSVTTDLPGSLWTVGSAEPIDVLGPDWAIAAWLTGRPVVAGALTTTPELRAWM